MSCEWQTRLLKMDQKEQRNVIFVCEFCARVFFSVRCGGSVSCHQACGARHQGNSCVLREAAAASEGHQPRVEQPHGLHVAGQARGKMLRKI